METRKSGNLGISERFLAAKILSRISPRSRLNFCTGVHICGRCVDDVAFAVLGNVLSASRFLVVVVFSSSDEF